MSSRSTVSRRASAGRSSIERDGGEHGGGDAGVAEGGEGGRGVRVRAGGGEAREGDERGREAEARDEASRELGYRVEVPGAGAGDQHDVRPRPRRPLGPRRGVSAGGQRLNHRSQRLRRAAAPTVGRAEGTRTRVVGVSEF